MLKKQWVVNFTARGYYEPTKLLAPSGLVSSVGREVMGSSPVHADQQQACKSDIKCL